MENKPQAAQTVIPVIEEQLHIDKVWQETGRVQVSKTVTEEAVDYALPLQQEEVIMERKPINQYVETAPPASRYEGETLIIPVVKEVLVVEKKLMLVEELHITKRHSEQTVSGTEILRKESVTVTRTPSNQGMPEYIAASNTPAEQALTNNTPPNNTLTDPATAANYTGTNNESLA